MEHRCEPMARLVARMSGALLASCRSQSWGRAARSGDTPHLAVGPRLRRAPPAHAGYGGFVRPLRTRLSDATIFDSIDFHGCNLDHAFPFLRLAVQERGEILGRA